MRRTHDYFGATNRGGNVPAFSTPSPGEELMKRLRLLPQRSGHSAPALFVCLFEPAILFRCPSSAFYRGPSTLPSPLPARFPVRPTPLSPPPATTQHRKHHSNPIGSRRGFLQTAVSKARAVPALVAPSLSHRRASDTALTFLRSQWAVWGVNGLQHLSGLATSQVITRCGGQGTKYRKNTEP